MNRKELNASILEQTGVDKAVVLSVVESLFDIIVKSAINDEVVKTDLGTFSPHVSNARKGRNPSNGEVIDIAAKRSIKLKLSTDVKDRLNIVV